LARIALALGDPAAAQDAARRALAGGADRAAALVLLGDALLQQGHFDDVLREVAPADGDPPDLASEIARIESQALRGGGQTAAAKAALERALALNPNNARAWLAGALAALADGDRGAARTQAERATALDPNLSPAWMVLGALAQEAGELDAAARAYDRAVDSAEADALPRFQRALLRIDRNDLDGAEQDLSAVEDQVPRFPGLDYGRGRLLLARGQDAEALARLQRALEALPSAVEPQWYTAVALVRLNRLAEAQERLLGLVQSAPEATDAVLLLARIRLARGDPAGAEAAAQPLAGRGSAPAAAVLLLAEAMRAQGRGAQADALLATAAAARPDDPELGFAAARGQIAAGDTAGGIAELRALLERHPQALPARSLLVETLTRTGERDEALAQARALVAAAPRDPAALNDLAAAQAASGDAPGAERSLREALAAAPGAVGPTLNLARLENARGDRAAARATLAPLLAERPTDLDALGLAAALDAADGDPAAGAAGVARLHAALAAAPDALALRLALAARLMQDGRRAEAGRLLAEAPPAAAERPEVLRLSGLLALQDGRLEAARADFERLAAALPRSAEPRYLLAQALAAQGETGPAQRALGQALAIDARDAQAAETLRLVAAAIPELPARRQWLATLSEQTRAAPAVLRLEAAAALADGDASAAAVRYETLAAADPDDRDAGAGLVASRHAQRQTRHALTAADDWLARHPGDPDFLLMQGSLRMELGDADGAIATYTELLTPGLLKQSPPLAQVRNNLAWLLRERDPARALTLAEEAHRLAPDQADYADTLAGVLLARGEAARARPLLKAAHAGRPGDPGIAYRYALALAQTGDRDGARRVLLELGRQPFPEQADAAALLKRLGR